MSSTHQSKLSITFAVLVMALLLLTSPCCVRGAAVWQWSIPVRGGVDKAGPARAFLWIPENCAQVRGVVVAQNNMEEEMILENPKLRHTLADLGFAEVWVAPAFNLLFRFDRGAGETFNGMMADLAVVSGYDELNYVPIVPIGHSAAASAPYYFAAWDPERTLAALSISGQWPYVRDQNFAPDIWGTRTIDTIPLLETMGEYESAESWASEGLRERQQHPMMPLSMASGPAQSHFMAADAKIDYLCFYLRKAAAYRLPKGWDGKSAPKLLPIDPTKTGWLVDRWHKDQPPIAAPAPVAEYKGDRTQAFWYFDRDMAQATAAYEAAYSGEKVDLLGYVQDASIVPQTNSHLQVTLKFEPEADGVTFKLTSTFLDTVPGESPRPATWTGLPAGSPVGHAAGGDPISIDRIVGPFEKLASDTFRVNLQKETIGTEKTFELVFAATQDGDKGFKPAVQQAHMYIPARNNKGADQHITFPLVRNQTVGATTVKLAARSDAGVPVSYYVREGPAEVVGDTLLLTAIPPRAKFPVAVTVVAWQYGRAIEPLLESADSVGCTFYIVKPGESAPAAGYISLAPPAPPVPAVTAASAQLPPTASLPPVLQTSATNAIGFHFCSNVTMQPGDLAGAEDRVDNWNNINGSEPIGLSAAVDKDGRPVHGMTVSVAGGGAEYHLLDVSKDASRTSNDTRLFNGMLDEYDGSPESIDITGIPYAKYDVFFYRGDDGSKRAGKFTIGSTTIYIRGGVGSPKPDGSGYVRSNDGRPGNGTDIDQGNYVEFDNVTGATLHATFGAVNAGDNVQRCKLVGFQIVESK